MGDTNISWCDVCNVKLTSSTASVQHLNGRVHRSKVNALKGPADKSSPSNTLKRSSEVANTKTIGQESSSKRSKGNNQQAPGHVSVATKKAELEAADSDVSCDVCDKEFSSALAALRHFKGGEHASKIASTYKQKGQKKEAEKHDGVLKCEDCDIEFSTDMIALQHFKGKKHAARIESISKEKKKMEKPDPNLKCEVCDKVFPTTLIAVQHFQGKKHAANLKSSSKDVQPLNGQLHKSAVNVVKGPEDKPAANKLSKKEAPDHKSAVTEKKEKKVFDSDLKCEVCDKLFTTGISALQHFKGKKHALKMKAQGSEKPKKDLSCDVCDKRFSSDEIAIQHFKGKKHASKVTSKMIQERNQARQESNRGGRGGRGGAGRGRWSGSSGRGGSSNRSEVKPSKGGQNSYRYSPYNINLNKSSPSDSSGLYKNFNSGSIYMSNTDATLAHITSVSDDIIHLKRMLREYEY